MATQQTDVVEPTTLNVDDVLALLHETRNPVGRWLWVVDVGGFSEHSRVFGWRRGGWKELGPFPGDGFGGDVADLLSRGGLISVSPILREHHAGFPFALASTVWVSKKVDLEPRRPVEPLPRRVAASVAAVRAELATLPVPPHVLLDEGDHIVGVWKLREPAPVEAIRPLLVNLAERINGERRQAGPGDARWLLPNVLSHALYPPFTVRAEQLRPGRVPLSDLSAWILSPP